MSGLSKTGCIFCSLTNWATVVYWTKFLHHLEFVALWRVMRFFLKSQGKKTCHSFIGPACAEKVPCGVAHGRHEDTKQVIASSSLIPPETRNLMNTSARTRQALESMPVPLRETLQLFFGAIAWTLIKFCVWNCSIFSGVLLFFWSLNWSYRGRRE